MQVLLSMILFLAFTGYSNAAYCVCKDGVGEQALQSAIDYACGAGADCTQIQSNGPCYQPNNIKAHCDFAVNSYFQKKGSSGAQNSCDFSGTATLTNSPPPSGSGSCFSSSGGGTGMTPPSTGGMGIPSSTPTPGTGTGTTTPSTGTGMTTPTTGGSTNGNPSVFGPGSMGLGPTASGTGIDSSDGAATHSVALVGSLAMSFLTSHIVLMWA